MSILNEAPGLPINVVVGTDVEPQSAVFLDTNLSLVFTMTPLNRCRCLY